LYIFLKFNGCFRALLSGQQNLGIELHMKNHIYIYPNVITGSCNLDILFSMIRRGRRGRDRIVVGFTTIYAISAYHH
jgi:hypothetical protein